MQKVIDYLENHVFATKLQKQKTWRITDQYAKELDNEIEVFEKAISILKSKKTHTKIKGVSNGNNESFNPITEVC